jgi:hypothetical protein
MMVTVTVTDTVTVTSSVGSQNGNASALCGACAWMLGEREMGLSSFPVRYVAKLENTCLVTVTAAEIVSAHGHGHGHGVLVIIKPNGPES